jgi:hypothetical protein
MMNRLRAGKVLLVLGVMGCLALVVILVAVNPWPRSLDSIHKYRWHHRMAQIGVLLALFIVPASAAALGLLWRDPRRVLAAACLVIGLFPVLLPSLFLFLFYGFGADWQVPSTHSKAQSDMRSVAIALEAYMEDTKQYPPWTLDPKQQVSFLHEGPPIPTFLSDKPGSRIPFSGFQKILGELPGDTFGGSVKGVDGKRINSTFAYWAPEDKGWILWSPGPDEVFDMNFEAVKKVYDPKISNPTLELIVSYTYDATNGTVSAGDIWRVKQ